MYVMSAETATEQIIVLQRETDYHVNCNNTDKRMVNSLPIIRKILSLVTLAVIAIAAFSGAFLLQSSRRAMSVAAEAPGAHSTGSNIRSAAIFSETQYVMKTEIHSEATVLTRTGTLLIRTAR